MTFALPNIKYKILSDPFSEGRINTRKELNPKFDLKEPQREIAQINSFEQSKFETWGNEILIKSFSFRQILIFQCQNFHAL